MKFTEILDLIYGKRPDTPRCGHCSRPLVLVNDNGKKYLYCKHCEDLKREEQEPKTITRR